jgi:hypothetical protein
MKLVVDDLSWFQPYNQSCKMYYCPKQLGICVWYRIKIPSSACNTCNLLSKLSFKEILVLQNRKNIASLTN